MHKKSLAIFIIAAAGLVFGIFLMEAGFLNQIHVEGPSISIITERSDFKQGEEIKIRLVNTGTVTLDYHDTSHGLAIYDSDGVWQHPTTVGDAGVRLEPGEEAHLASWTQPWHQTDVDGNQVPAGTYTISAKMYSEQGVAESSVTVTISE